MSIATIITEDPATLAPLIPQFPVRRMSVADYQQLVASGFFGSERVELWDGLVVERMPHGPLASFVITRLARWLDRGLSDEVTVRCQLPIQLSKSAPEPDVAIVRGPEIQYLECLPTAADVLLLIEVSDSTLADDRRTKQRIYAAAGIAAYWIINCVDRDVEIYTEPETIDGESRFRNRQTVYSGKSVSVCLPGQPTLEMPVASLFGQTQ
jgi:Uma2 family endonuclease